MRFAVAPCALACLILGGCASISEQHIGVSRSPGQDEARLVVHRPSGSLQYLLRDVRVRVGGKASFSLASGATAWLNVPAGDIELRVDLWDVPGECELKVRLNPGEEKQVVVTPRLANVLPALPMLGQNPMTPGQFLAGGALMLAGMAIESGDKACAGAFAAQAAEPSKMPPPPLLP